MDRLLNRGDIPILVQLRFTQSETVHHANVIRQWEGNAYIISSPSRLIINVDYVGYVQRNIIKMCDCLTWTNINWIKQKI